ncbi:efflux transporter outer membrane subunit [Cupriavidus sp. RAF12]|uniref:efflux transporter outer membrane subunit n=1 Tax=Cupriavidus sp. RAF12 TaxID=3233050 RepID=UPI003F8EADAE
MTQPLSDFRLSPEASSWTVPALRHPGELGVLSALSVFGAAMFLTGCASMTGLETQATVDDANRLAATASLGATPVSPAAWPRRAWWQDFGDPQLDALVEAALAGQPTLRVAAARVRQAYALAGGAKSALFPQVNLDATSTRQRFSENGLAPPPLAGSWKWSSDVQLGLGYELDFWGKNKATFDAALDRARAAEVDYHAARLMLTTSVVQTYLRLDAAYAQRALTEQTYRQRQNTLDLTRRRVDAQLDSRLDMKQAEAALPATRERLAAINEIIALTQNQLAALAGNGPDAGADIRRPQLRDGYAAAVPASLPADLIGRRPDVVAQRWRVEAASHEIRAAKAQFYPNISLTAFAGLQSLSLSDLLMAGSRTFGIGPAISLPIFDGGRLRSNLGVTQAEYDAAAEQYNATLITALHDVVNQLVSLRWLAERASEQKEALQLTQEAYDLAVSRYRSGVGNYLQVLSAEGQVLQQKQLLIDIQTQERTLHLELIRALGGGYEVAATPANGMGAATRSAS